MATLDIDPEARPERARLVLFGRVAFAIICVSAALVAAMWLLFGGEDRSGPAPVITATAGPDRVRPDADKPNGQAIPHQDRQVFDVVTPDSGNGRQETLSQGREQPVTIPNLSATVQPRPAPARGGPVQLLPPNPPPDTIDPPRTVTMLPPEGQADNQDANQAPPPTLPPLIASPTAKPEAMPAPEQPQTGRAATPAPAAPRLESQPKPATKPEPVRREVASLPPSDNYRIQIGAVRSRDAAQREWLRMKRKNPDILGGLQLFIQQVNIRDKGVFHRIQAGPLPDKILAELACGSLKSRGLGCLVVAQ